MTDLDYVDLSRQMAALARGAEEHAASPEVSPSQRRLLKRQVRAAADASGLYALAAGAPSDRDTTRTLKRALRHQKRFLDLADELIASGGV